MELDRPLRSRAEFLRSRFEVEERDGISWTHVFGRVVRARIDAAFHICLTSLNVRPMAFDTELGDLLSQHSEYPKAFMSLSSSLVGGLQFDDSWVVDLLDAAALVITTISAGPWVKAPPVDGRDAALASLFTSMNDALLAGRVAYVFIDGRLHDRSLEPMHQTLIVPLEHVLTSTPAFGDAERAYLQASSEMASGHYGASITSAGSALQAALVALGAKGNDLGALFSDASKRGFLQGHDEKLIYSFKNISAWITADRSHRGNAHGPATALRADSQLAIHIVGALIIRLVSLRMDTADDPGTSPSIEKQPFRS
jgi:hypothetical protein